jgi:hypothetical protein
MPFTVSHIAAVLPGHRMLSRAHVFSAAVIGSMVPDFDLLAPVFPPRVQTHSLIGLFSFCLPVGLIAYWLTLVLIKPAMVEVLPDGAYARVREADATARGPAARTWLLAGLAVLGGAVTHLIWDAFTHEHAGGVRMFPVLKDYSADLDGHTLQLNIWLQLLSSAAGLMVVIAALIVWLRHVPRSPVRPPRRLGAAERCGWSSLYVGLPLLAIVMVTGFGRAAVALSLGVWLEHAAVAGMRASVVSLLLVSVLLRARLALLARA